MAAFPDLTSTEAAVEIESQLGEADAAAFRRFTALHQAVDELFRTQLDRSLPASEALTNRWDRARRLGFGEGSSIYDSCLVLGTPTVGARCWIGPFTILDGSGGLTLGDHCTVSAGAQIYSHDNVMQTLSSHVLPIERSPVHIGSNVYLGPNCVVARGVSIGERSVVGTGAFVNRDVPDHSIVVGSPARVVGRVVHEDGRIKLEYDR